MRVQRGLAGIKGLHPAQISRLLPELEQEGRFAKAIWNALGGELDWSGIAFLCNFHDLPDPEALIDDLLTIRRTSQEKT